MLPAKFRGFASRVGRLASRALAWHKTSERDAALNSASSTSSTARTSRTLLRALFAMLVAVATLLAMLILPPVKQASAGQAYWDKFGNAVVAADHSNLGSAFVNMKTGDCTKYELDNGTCKDEYYPIVEPGKGTNGRTKITFRGVFNPLLDKHRFNTRPVFYLITPRGLVDDTIRITREVKWITLKKIPGKNIPIHKPQDNWELRGNGNETVGQFYNPGKQRYTFLKPGDYYSDTYNYNHFWDVSLGVKGCGSNESSMCELYAWKNRGEVGRIFQSWEKPKEAVYRWTVTADVDPRYDPYQLFFAMGYTDDSNENVENKDSVRHYTVSGPYDTDGDGIPDFEEYNMGDKPGHGVDQTTKGGMKYDEVNNVEPFTSSESKNYFETGTWDGDTVNGHFVKDGGKTYKLPTLAGLAYSFEGEPTDEKGNKVKVTYDNDHGTAHTLSPGHAWLDPLTGHVSFNPGPEHKRHTITFPIQVKYPDPSLYNCKHSQKDRLIEHLQAKFKVEPMSRFYYPEWDNTTVTAGSSKQSTEPHSKKDDRRGTKYAAKLPAKSFTLKKYGKYGQERLKWSSLTNGGDKTGKVTFSPDKTMDADNYKTPVVVTYLDGSTSEDADSGNKGNPVYAPVTVTEPGVNDGDLHLNLYDGTQINNGQFGGWSFGDANKPKELSKGTKIGAPKDNKNNGIVLDSWANNAKGPITFRAVCHKKNDTKYKLLKPAEGKNKASGDINGLQFEEFRQWKRGNDKNCKDKNTCDLNTYLHNSEYNKDTMERSRALIGGKPKEGGEYECKVFAFHQAHGGKGTEHNGALKNFDNLASTGPSAVYNIGSIPQFASVKGKEWVSGNFYFKIKLKDNQKYNPTYVKIPEIKAGTFANKETNSSGQPKSHTKIMVDGKKVNANGVPDEDLGGVEDGKALPPGTWFEIKKLVKKVDKTQPDKFPYEKELWSNFEGGEDNVKRDNSGKPVTEKGKVVPLNETGREYGSVTFRPDKWKDAGQYWAEVVVHYPDGSASSDDDSINYKHPVYAKVNVTRDDAHNQFGLALYKDYPNKSMGNGYDLKVGESPSPDATFDSWLTKSVGPIHLHMICSKNTKDGTKTKQTEYTYNRLPGHTESEGLRLKDQKIWGHATFEQQKSCIKNSNDCKPDTLLYDDWVHGGNSNNTSERTRGFFGGKAQKTGDYECKVYAIKGDQKKSDAFKKAVEANIEKNKKDKKDVDPVPSVLNASGNPYGTEGVGYKTGSFDIRIHNDNQLYNPTYTTIPEIEAGSTYNAKKAAISSGAPQSKKKVTEGSTEVNANGVSDYDLQNVKEGALPAGTWYEIKRFVKAGDISKTSAKSLPWANFEDGEDNKADGKQEAKDSNATNKGSVTFRPDKWQDADEYWAEIRVHYPDGTTSDGEGSINKDHPIYAKVKVTRPAIDSGDLHLNVYKQYENGKFTGYVDDVNGITVMKGVGLLKDMGIDSWSTAKPEGITLRALCRDDSDEAKKSTTHIWSENLDNLFFKLNWQQAWKYPTFARQETCRKGSNNGDGCDTGNEHLLFDSTRDTMERARGTITSDKAPTKSGKYYCVVLAMKLTDLGKYKKAIKNSKISVTNNNFAKAMGFTDTEGIDWTAKYFPVTVVEKFALPKTGGEGMSMALLVVAMIAMCVMCGAFFVDQTKWGHAMLVGAAGAAVSAAAGMMCGLRGATQNSNSNTNSKISEIWRGLVKKVKDIRRFDDYSASVKDFVRKATGWLRAALRRVGRWAAERWRC